MNYVNNIEKEIEQEKNEQWENQYLKASRFLESQEINVNIGIHNAYDSIK